MTSYERVSAALAHREADRVPAAPILCGMTRNLINADYPTWSTNAEVCASAFLRATEVYHTDALITLIDLSVECEAWGADIVYPKDEAAHPNYKNPVIKEIEDYAKIQTIDYRTGKRMMMHLDVCRRLVEKLKGKVPVIAFVFGPMGVLSMLRNQQEMYMDLYDDVDAVKGAVMRIAETLRDYAAALCDIGVDAIMWDTLFASGSIMKKSMWQETEGEAMRMLAQTVRDHGCRNMIHNCGQRIYFDAQIDSMQPDAISFLYPPDDCADFRECKAKYGDKVTLIGCVPPSNAVIGTDEEWDAICRDQIRDMAAGGGFVLSTGCEYPANAPDARLLRLLDIAEQAKY